MRAVVIRHFHLFFGHLSVDWASVRHFLDEQLHIVPSQAFG